MKQIRVEHIAPPIPTTEFDWVAYYDGEEERGNYGYGATREGAVCDLVANFHEDGSPVRCSDGFAHGMTCAVGAHVLVALAVFGALAFSSGALTRYVETALMVSR